MQFTCPFEIAVNSGLLRLGRGRRRHRAREPRHRAGLADAPAQGDRGRRDHRLRPWGDAGPAWARAGISSATCSSPSCWWAWSRWGSTPCSASTKRAAVFPGPAISPGPPGKPQAGLSGYFSASGRPATTRKTRSASAATAWLSRPAASRNRRASVVGTIPEPDLVRDHDPRPPPPRQRCRQCGGLGFRSAPAGNRLLSQASAIDDHHRPSGTARRRPPARAAPRWSAIRGRDQAMPRDPDPPSRRQSASAVAI